MKGTSYGIAARVKLLPTFAGTAGQDLTSGLPFANDAFLFDKALSDRLSGDLLDVTVRSSLSQPAAVFSLTLAARPVLGLSSWAELIRPFALITILLHRSGPTGDPAVTSQPEPVLLGLVDPGGVRIAEDYSGAEPRRVVQVTGRSLASLLTDQPWWFNHYLSAHPPPQLADYFESAANIGAAPSLQALGFFAVDFNLFTDLPRLTPVAAMRTVYDFFVGSPGKPGFIKFQTADGRSLRQRLRFDAAMAEASFFDPGARFMQQLLPTQSQFQDDNCWQAMQLFAEQPFVEMFSDTFGTTAEDAHVDIAVRKPPWAGHITYPDKGASVGFSTATAPGVGASLFDSEYGGWSARERFEAPTGDLMDGWDAQRHSLLIRDSDVIGVPSLARGATEVFNAFEVRPQIGSPAGDNQGDRVFQADTPPIIDADPESPSYVRRFGIRRHPFRSTKYIPITTENNSTRVPAGGWSRHATAYAALLRTWLHWNPEMLSGTYLVKGRTALRIGRRLVDVDRGLEFYITGVVHRMVLTGLQPTYTTAVQVERGWAIGDGR